MKSLKIVIPAVAVIGVGLGSVGLANAFTSPGGVPAAPQIDEEIEAPGDDAVDGVDHQFEGEEVGENGNGIPDADEIAEVDGSSATDGSAGAVDATSGLRAGQIAAATVAAVAPSAAPSEPVAGGETTEADEAADDEADDGVDHQFEGEEVGENGNGIPDADDAIEADETNETNDVEDD